MVSMFVELISAALSLLYSLESETVVMGEAQGRMKERLRDGERTHIRYRATLEECLSLNVLESHLHHCSGQYRHSGREHAWTRRQRIRG